MIAHVWSRAAYVLPSLECCAPVWMSSHVGLLESIVTSAEMLWEAELYCFGHRRKVSALCLLYKIYHRVAHSMNEYLSHFVAVRNARASAALGELAVVIPRCRTVHSVGRFYLLLSVCGTCLVVTS